MWQSAFMLLSHHCKGDYIFESTGFDNQSTILSGWYSNCICPNSLSRQFMPAIRFSSNPPLFLDEGMCMGMAGMPPMHACRIPAPSFRWWMWCRLLLKNQCMCSCSRMEPSAWIEREPDRRTGISRQPAEPAWAQYPATAAASPSLWGAVWKQAGFPRSNRNIPLDNILARDWGSPLEPGNIPRFHQVGPFRSGGELQALWIQICSTLFYPYCSNLE